MRRIPLWLMVIVAVVPTVLVGTPFPRRTSTLCKCRVGSRSPSSGDTKIGRPSRLVTPETIDVILANPETIEPTRPGFRQRQTFPGRRQDGEDPLEPEKVFGGLRPVDEVPGTLMTLISW